MGRGIACDIVGEPPRYFKRKNPPIGARPTVRRAWPGLPQTADTLNPDIFRMQFPPSNNRRELKNRGISTIRFQNLKYGQGNCMRHCWGTTPVFQTEEPTDWSAPDGPESLTAAPTRVIEKAPPHPHFARNLTRSFFEIGHKRCNSNDTNSTFEQATGELRATLLGNHSGTSNGRTHRYGGRQHQAGPHRPEIVCRDTATGTPQRGEAATGFPATASSRSAALSEAPPIRRSCPRGPRPRRGQPRGGRRGRGTGSRTRSRHPRCGRSGSTAGRHRARHTRRA